MTKWVVLIGLLLYGVFLTQCTVPEAKDESVATLVLASDFLTANDTLIFRDFEKEHQLRVRIRHMSTDSIISHFRAYGYNSSFDGVLLYSTYNLHRLSKAEVLHVLPEFVREQPAAIRAPKNDWLVVGFDPYVLEQADSGAVIQTYNELTYGSKWTSVLNHEERAAFEASVLHQFGRSGRYKSFTWLSSMYTQMNGSTSDSVTHADFTLNRFSKMQDTKHRFTIPNQVRGGVFYDGIGIGAIRHSAHYSTVCDLIAFYLNPHYNQKLNGRLHLFPIASPNNHSDFDYQNDYPILFRCSPNQCVRHYRDLERMWLKLE